jgi:hypothetical protein
VAPAFVMLALVLTTGSPLCGRDEHAVQVEQSQPLPRGGPGLGTRAYVPLPDEAQAIKGWSEEELNSGSPETKSLHGRVGKRVAWLGSRPATWRATDRSVRQVEEHKNRRETVLDVEMKFFDGLTDLHQQVVSLYGAGDFHVVIPGTGHRIKQLALVRVYGTVERDSGERESGGLPVVSPEFVRVWDWTLFAFMPYGNDHGNPNWVKLRKMDESRIYSSRPDVPYYEQISELAERCVTSVRSNSWYRKLGKRKRFSGEARGPRGAPQGDVPPIRHAPDAGWHAHGFA